MARRLAKKEHVGMTGRVRRVLLALVCLCAACSEKPPAPVPEGTIEVVRGSLEVGDCFTEQSVYIRCRRFAFFVKNTGPGCVDAKTLGGVIDLRNGWRTPNRAEWQLDEKEPAVFAVGETRRAIERALTLTPGNNQLTPFEISTTTKQNVACQ
jgi:hypothetical protein